MALEVETERRVLQSLLGRAYQTFQAPRQFLDESVEARLQTSEKITANMSESKMQKAVLTIALEHDLVQFFDEIIRDANAEDINGPFIRTFSAWASNYIDQVDRKISDLSSPLFGGDESCQLSQKDLHALHAQACDIKVLIYSLDALIDIIGDAEDPCKPCLLTYFDKAPLIGIRIQMLLSFYNAALLPQKDATNNGELGYHFELLMNRYTSQRQRVRYENEEWSDILLIDGIINEIHANVEEKIWEPNLNGCFYPPPSIESVVNLYSRGDIPIDLKHTLFIYFLHDVIVSNAATEGEQQNPKLHSNLSALRQLPRTLLLPETFENFVRGLRCIDFGSFSDAIDLLSDSSVGEILSSDPFSFGENLMTTIKVRSIHLLLRFGKASAALELFKSIGDYFDSIPNRHSLHMSLLIENNLLYEAFVYQRKVRQEEPDNQLELLFRFYENVDEAKLMETVFKFPLDALESDLLVEYLITRSPSENGKHLALVYYIINSRYLDASILISESAREFHEIRDPELRADMNRLIELINGAISNMPGLAEESQSACSRYRNNDSSVSATQSARKMRHRTQLGEFDRLTPLVENQLAPPPLSGLQFTPRSTPARHVIGSDFAPEDMILKSSDVKAKSRNRSGSSRASNRKTGTRAGSTPSTRGGTPMRGTTPSMDESRTLTMTLRPKK